MTAVTRVPANPFTTPPVVSAATKRILEGDYMSATLSTASGSRYTVVARPGHVTVIHDQDGWIRQGVDLEILNGRLCLSGYDRDGYMIRLVETTRITQVYILEN